MSHSGLKFEFILHKAFIRPGFQYQFWFQTEKTPGVTCQSRHRATLQYTTAKAAGEPCREKQLNRDEFSAKTDKTLEGIVHNEGGQYTYRIRTPRT